MADNYLEKKYEELQHGKSVVRRSTPSLDSLLKRLVAAGEPSTEYLIKQAQLDAMVRSASMLGGSLVFETSETVAGEKPACVRVSAESGSAPALGEAVLALRLKAAELHLETIADYSEGSAVVLVYKN